MSTSPQILGEAGNSDLPVEALDTYLSALLNETEPLLVGQPEGVSDSNNISLKDVWEIPTVSIDSTSMQAGFRHTLQSPASLASVKSDPHLAHAVVVGQPGFGKTTLCRAMAYKYAVQARTTKSGWIPVLLSLKDINAKGVWQDSEDLCKRALLNIGCSADLAKKLHESFAKGHFWIFLDGLDEVESTRHNEVVSAIRRLFESNNRVWITCRHVDYTKSGMPRKLSAPILILNEFSDPQLDTYIENWHLAAGFPKDSIRIVRLAKTRALLADKEIRTIARTPMLAALICVIGGASGSFVNSRAGLLRRATRELLAPRDDSLSSDSNNSQHIESEFFDLILSVVHKLAFAMNGCDSTHRALTITESQLHDFVTQTVDEALKYEDIDDAAKRNIVDRVVARIAGVSAKGILQKRSINEFEFVHRYFQDCLCAEYIRFSLKRERVLELAYRPELAETFHLLAALCQIDNNLEYAFFLIIRLLAKVAPALLMDNIEIAQIDHTDHLRACIAGEMLAEFSPKYLRDSGCGSVLDGSAANCPWLHTASNFQSLRPDTATICLKIATYKDLSEDIRKRAIFAASRLGDPRFVNRSGDLIFDGDRLIPINGGKGNVGTSEPLKMTEPKKLPSAPLRKIEVKQFQMGRFPVTNIEYRCFIEDDGYKNPEWWEDGAGSLWRAQDKSLIAELCKLWISRMPQNFWKEQAEADYKSAAEEAVAKIIMQRTEPLYWSDTRFNTPTAPVVGVNWWEANAYCAWYTHSLQKMGVINQTSVVCLPSEEEWEWVASRQHLNETHSPTPWGDVFDPKHLLIRDFSDEANPTIRNFGALPVGFYSLGNARMKNQPEDLSGNVWEWVSSPKPILENRADETQNGHLHERVVRGGSWFSREPLSWHSAFRLFDPPCNAYWDLGFRIVVR